MKIIIQKFGGSSLNSEKGRLKAVEHIEEARKLGYRVVVVVSAMGRQGEPYATDTLLHWLKQNGDAVAEREKDLLLSCGEIISGVTMTSLLHSRGIPACTLSGLQAGIITNDDFSKAKIISVYPERLLELCQQEIVPVVCGFQGGTLQGEITTLGRGGSDTTATALGKALRAEFVDIFTDVHGVMTADPRLVEEAVPLAAVTYTEICNLAYQGARVIHPRAVEIAMDNSTPLRIRSLMSTGIGTLVSSEYHLQQLHGQISERLITGITQIPYVTQIKVIDQNYEYDTQVKVFKAMAENKISIDFINVSPVAVVFTVADEVAEKALSILEKMGYIPEVKHDCAKVSLVGAGMAGVPGVMSQITETLLAVDIQILQAADSHTTIWVLVNGYDMQKAVKALHRQFNLHKV